MSLEALRQCSVGRPRECLASLAHLAYQRGLVHATAGNASLRVPGGFLCTPSGSCLGDVRPIELVGVNDRWIPAPEQGVLSSEWRMHAAIFERVAEANAVLHTHSHAATLLAVHQVGVPAVTPEAAYHLGVVRCLAPAEPGSVELAIAVGVAMGEGARAVLLGHHGCVAWGSDAREAFFRAELLEATARLAWDLRQGGEPS